MLGIVETWPISHQQKDPKGSGRAFAMNLDAAWPAEQVAAFTALARSYQLA